MVVGATAGLLRLVCLRADTNCSAHAGARANQIDLRRRSWGAEAMAMASSVSQCRTFSWHAVLCRPKITSLMRLSYP
jgi:hypothetical protein